MSVPQLQSKRVKTTLHVPLTADEMKRYADEAATLMGTLDEKEEEYKAVQREWRNELKQIRLDIRKFLNAYKNRAEEREVECEQHFDSKAGETWFTHEGKEHGRRALDAYELAQVKQGNLFGDGANLPKDKKAKDVESDEDEDYDEGDDELDNPPIAASFGARS
jgi:hypothetical protein